MEAANLGVHFMSQESLAGRAGALLRDYAELTKARITTLIVLTAWCGYFFGAHRAGVASWSLGLFHALLGVALVSSGTAALNEVMEASVDSRMRRTASRPLPSGRMSRAHALAVGLGLTLGGSIYLAIYANLLTGSAGVSDRARLPRGLYAAKESFAGVHVCGRISGSYASGIGMDCGPRTHRNGNSDPVCDHVHLAIPALLVRSHGSIARTMSRDKSECCRWWSRMENRQYGGFWLIRLR